MQNVADCRGTKLTSLKVVPYGVLLNMIADSSLREWCSEVCKGKFSGGYVKVTAGVPRVENFSGSRRIRQTTGADFFSLGGKALNRRGRREKPQRTQRKPFGLRMLAVFGEFCGWKLCW